MRATGRINKFASLPRLTNRRCGAGIPICQAYRSGGHMHAPTVNPRATIRQASTSPNPHQFGMLPNVIICYGIISLRPPSNQLQLQSLTRLVPCRTEPGSAAVITSPRHPLLSTPSVGQAIPCRPRITKRSQSQCKLYRRRHLRSVNTRTARPRQSRFVIHSSFRFRHSELLPPPLPITLSPCHPDPDPSGPSGHLFGHYPDPAGSARDTFGTQSGHRSGHNSDA